jgi:NADPH2:quinone reductase
METLSTQVFEFLANGLVKQKIHEVYPLEDVARAHEDFTGRKTTGKLLLRP